MTRNTGSKWVVLFGMIRSEITMDIATADRYGLDSDLGLSLAGSRLFEVNEFECRGCG